MGMDDTRTDTNPIFIDYDGTVAIAKGVPVIINKIVWSGGDAYDGETGWMTIKNYDENRTIWQATNDVANRTQMIKFHNGLVVTDGVTVTMCGSGKVYIYI
jgi:hypothetical protein